MYTCIIFQEQNLYEEFLIRQCKRMFNENKMIIVIQPTATDRGTIQKIRNKLFHKGMEVMQWRNYIVLLVLCYALK